MLFEFTNKKVQKMKDESNKVLKKGIMSVKEICQPITKLISIIQAVIAAKLYCRYMQDQWFARK